MAQLMIKNEMIKNEFRYDYFEKLTKTLEPFRLQNFNKYWCSYENALWLDKNAQNDDFEIEAHNGQFKIVSKNLQSFLNAKYYDKSQQLNQLSQVGSGFIYNCDTQQIIWNDTNNNFQIIFNSVWALDKMLQVQLMKISAIFKIIKNYNEQMRRFEQTKCFIKLLSVNIEIDFNATSDIATSNQDNYPNILKTKWKCQFWINGRDEIVDDAPINQINPELNQFLTTWNYWN